MAKPDPKSIVDGLLGTPGPDDAGGDAGGGGDGEAAMGDFLDAVKAGDAKAAWAAFQHALALADAS